MLGVPAAIVGGGVTGARCRHSDALKRLAIVFAAAFAACGALLYATIPSMAAPRIGFTCVGAGLASAAALFLPRLNGEAEAAAPSRTDG